MHNAMANNTSFAPINKRLLITIKQMHTEMATRNTQGLQSDIEPMNHIPLLKDNEHTYAFHKFLSLSATNLQNPSTTVAKEHTDFSADLHNHFVTETSCHQIATGTASRLPML